MQLIERDSDCSIVGRTGMKVELLRTAPNTKLQNWSDKKMPLLLSSQWHMTSVPGPSLYHNCWPCHHWSALCVWYLAATFPATTEESEPSFFAFLITSARVCLPSGVSCRQSPGNNPFLERQGKLAKQVFSFFSLVGWGNLALSNLDSSMVNLSNSEWSSGSG